jgi:hypothetical protein
VALARDGPPVVERPPIDQDEPPVLRPALEERESAAAHDALERGLAFLALRLEQGVDGSFPTDGAQTAPVGIAALGALAFLSGGSVPGRGPHGASLERLISWLVDRTDLAPESRRFGTISSPLDSLSRNHGHGFATLALAEAYGMTPRGGGERLARALQAAVRRIELSQGAEGGWWYEPEISALHEGSVTICMVQALRAAKNAGIHVDEGVVRRAEDYVSRLQKPDGTFRYQLGREDSTVGLTAAGIATLNAAGRYDTRAIQAGIESIWARLALPESDPSERRFPLYERLYLAQAFWQLSDRSTYARWWDSEREHVLGTQAQDGSWPDAEGERFGRTYATAVQCLVLALPEGCLPIFQR